MTHLLGEKSVDCLRFIQANHAGSETYTRFEDRWAELCERWGAKAVLTKLEELYDRGYIECGVSVRSGWLTTKGELKLRELPESRDEAVGRRDPDRKF